MLHYFFIHPIFVVASHRKGPFRPLPTYELMEPPSTHGCKEIDTVTTVQTSNEESSLCYSSGPRNLACCALVSFVFGKHLSTYRALLNNTRYLDFSPITQYFCL